MKTKNTTLKSARVAKRWTWFKLANEANVSISTISRAEASESGWPPREDTRHRLQRALGVPVQ